MSRTVKVGGREIRLESFSGLKATWLIASLEAVGERWPQILDAKADFAKAYEQRNARQLERVTARHYYAPEPLMDEEPLIHEGQALTDQQGRVLVSRTPKLDESGKAIMGPDPLAHMTEADWQASGNKLSIPRAASEREQWLAVLPQAMKLAKDQVLQVLALVAMPESDLDRYDTEGVVESKAREHGRDLLKAPLRDLVKLAAAAGEMIDAELKDTAQELGAELPNALRLFGIEPSSQSGTGSSPTKPTSSTDSPAPTDGLPGMSSEPVTASSSVSDDG